MTTYFTPVDEDYPISHLLHNLVNSDQHKHKSTRFIARAINIHPNVVMRLRREPYLPAEDATMALLRYLLPQGSRLVIVY